MTNILSVRALVGLNLIIYQRKARQNKPLARTACRMPGRINININKENMAICLNR